MYRYDLSGRYDLLSHTYGIISRTISRTYDLNSLYIAYNLTCRLMNHVRNEAGNLLTVFFFVNLGPNSSQKFKAQLLLQITAKTFEASPDLSSYWSSKSYIWYFLNFEFPIFSIFFFFFRKCFEFTIVAYGETKTSISWKMSDHRATRGAIWDW